jgi:hypothetical protein
MQPTESISEKFNRQGKSMSTPPNHGKLKDHCTHCVIRVKPRCCTNAMLTTANYAVNNLFNNV